MSLFVRRDLQDYVPTHEGNYHFVKAGSGFPVVMMHPLGNSTWVWENIMGPLSEHFTCYAFDALGHGLVGQAALSVFTGGPCQGHGPSHADSQHT